MLLLMIMMHVMILIRHVLILIARLILDNYMTRIKKLLSDQSLNVNFVYGVYLLKTFIIKRKSLENQHFIETI